MQYSAVVDEEHDSTSSAHPSSHVDVVDAEDEVHLQQQRRMDPYAHLDDPRMGNKGDHLYTLPSNGVGKVRECIEATIIQS